ncbi:MAG: hypothetical protein ACLGH0_03730, partial [Thermoanaerobaculia bacterium]
MLDRGRVLFGVMAEQRLFRWTLGFGPLQLWFRVAVIVYLLVRHADGALAFAIAGGTLVIADVFEATRFFTAKMKQNPALTRSFIFFLGDIGFLLAAILRFQKPASRWYEAAFALLAVELLRRDFAGVVSHYTFNRQEILRRAPVAVAARPPDEPAVS